MHRQRTEHPADLEWEGHAEVQQQPEQSLEHGRTWCHGGAQVLGHEPRQGAFQQVVVDAGIDPRNVQDRIVQLGGIAARDRQQQAAEPRLLK